MVVEDNWCLLPTIFGKFRMYDTEDEEIRLISYGPIFDLGKNGNIPIVRIHSSCMASEIFGAVDCDCADQLRESMNIIASAKEGIIFHLQQEGRGQGLSNKIKAVKLMQQKGMDTVQAFEVLTLEQDIRNYQKVTNILFQLKISKIKLITNNPRKVSWIQKSGIAIAETIRTHPDVREENKDYLHAKKNKLGHNFCLERKGDQSS